MIAGDFNVCPTDEDSRPARSRPTDALVRPESRARFRRLLWDGLTDAVRAVHPHGAVYTFWDYQAGAWQRDSGLRIDHALLSPPRRAPGRRGTRPQERAEPQPSDHVPVVSSCTDTCRLSPSGPAPRRSGSRSTASGRESSPWRGRR